MGETAVIFTAMVGVLLLLARGPLPRRVHHEGRWITVKAGTTREELEARVARAGGGRENPKASDGADASGGGDG
jgi:FAD/FMN-containing dehydrogenase